MADDFIRRETAIEAVLERLHVGSEMDFAESALLDVSAADVAPVVRGRWIVEQDEYFGFRSADIKCSNCNSQPKHNDTTPYCPNCGAKMEAQDG